MLGGIIATAVGYAFPGFRITKLIKSTVNITSSSNPLILTKNITLTVIDCCTPPPVRLAAHCVGAVAVIGASIVSPNPYTLGSAFHLVNEIYDQC
jgi:hypothetical protein